MMLSLRRPVVLSSGRPFTRTGTHRHCHVASLTSQLVKLTFRCLGDNCDHWHSTMVNDPLSGQFNDPARMCRLLPLSIGRRTSRTTAKSKPVATFNGASVPDHRLDLAGTVHEIKFDG
jgi:hypothetical protein